MTSRLSAALEQWSGLATRYELVRVTPCDDEPMEPRPRLLLRSTSTPFCFLVCLDPRLCLAVTQRLVKNADTMVDPLPPIEEPILGAVAALVSHLIDEAAVGSPVRLGWGHLPEAKGQRFALEGILHWGQGAYELVVVVDLPWVPTREPRRPLDLAALGTLPLSLRLRVGKSRLSTHELGRLSVGAVFLPGEDLWIDAQGKGRGELVTTEGEWSYPCELVGPERIVLGPAAVNGAETTLGDVLAEAPLTVELELGSVTLPARDFASLMPGDVVETAIHLGEPITLRIGGRAVASAELVNIEGQLGVRIRELFKGEAR
jgi:flagellar motor switch/type III secretory pathway protein FliN